VLEVRQALRRMRQACWLSRSTSFGIMNMTLLLRNRIAQRKHRAGAGSQWLLHSLPEHG